MLASSSTTSTSSPDPRSGCADPFAARPGQMAAASVTGSSTVIVVPRPGAELTSSRPAARRMMPCTVARPSPAPLHILLVEDDPGDALLTQTLVRRAGLNTLWSVAGRLSEAAHRPAARRDDAGHRAGRRPGPDPGRPRPPRTAAGQPGR